MHAPLTCHPIRNQTIYALRLTNFRHSRHIPAYRQIFINDTRKTPPAQAHTEGEKFTPENRAVYYQFSPRSSKCARA